MSNRQMTQEEHDLVRWMLEHGKPEAAAFLPDVERALVTPWRCACGCASFDLIVQGLPEPARGKLHILGDFVFGSSDDLSGVFVYECAGILSGLEVYGLAGEAPKTLPSIASLKPF